MRNRNRGLVLAMEADEVVTDEVAMVPESQAEVETATAEVAEQVGEIEELTDATVEAETDAESLGDITSVAEDTVEAGEGMDETAAEMAEIAVESICMRLGIDNSKRSMPALESFNSKSTRLSATKLAIEDWKEKIAQIWKAIMTAVKMVGEKIKSFMLGLIKNRGMLEKHLENLKKRVDDLDGALKAKETEVKGSAGKAFGVDGKANAATAKQVLDNSAKLVAVAGTAVQNAARTAGSILNFEKDATGAAKSKGELVTAIAAEIKKLGEVSSKDGVTHYGHLIGGNSIVVSATEASDKAEATLDIQIAQMSKEQPKTAAALTREEMKEIIGAAIALVKGLKEYDKIEKDLANVSAQCVKVVDAVLKGAANKSDDKEAAEAIRKGAADVRQLNSMVAKFGASIPSAIYNAAKSAGDYVSASLANFGAEKAAEAKPEAKAA